MAIDQHGAHDKQDTGHVLPVHVINQIEMDVPRTGSDPLVLASLGRIRALLLRYAMEDPLLGYCQGMNSVAAAFIVASQTEAEAYRRFRSFMQQMRELWTPGFPLLQTGTTLFERLAEDRSWYQHLCSLDVHTTMYLPQAWLTSFAHWVPLETLSSCLEVLEYHGFAAMLAMTVAVLDCVGDKLLLQTSMDGALRVLKDLQHEVPPSKVLKANVKALLSEAFAIMAKPREPLLVHGANGVICQDRSRIEANNVAGWASSGSEVLRWAEEETMAIGHALWRWAWSENEGSSSRTIFSSGTSCNVVSI
jgi:hypothetical protein